MANRDRITRTKKDEGPLEMGGQIVAPGARIGGYVYMRDIGSGGMARVLLAKDPAGQLVALKVLRRSRFKTGLSRFRREYRALARIQHDNVIRVHAYGDVHGHPYIAMEYVDGPDLHTLTRSFRAWEPERRWRRVEEILVDLCRALAEIHRHGLVHRDLKPSNVLITSDGVCKLTDFGIVKDLDPSHDPHLSTTLVGTWAYASPEQITGQAIDYRSDLYSLGVILFAMLTSKRPFVANDMAGYLAQHRDRPAPAPRDVDRNIPAHLDEICRRLLQKAPRDRFQSAREILYRLEAEERVPMPSATDGWEPPLVGRDLELEVLGNAIGALTDRRGGVVVLEGDDGAGKSRLLDAASATIRDLGIPLQRDELRAQGPPYGTLLRHAAELVRDLGRGAPPGLAEDLRAFANGDAVRGDAQVVLYDSVRDAFRLALERGPRILLLDDLHRAPERSLRLLAFLVRALIVNEGLPLLLVVTLRPRASEAADAFVSGEELGLEPTEVFVGALSREDIDAIVTGLIGDDQAARRLALRLHRETQGNAYFVTEFLRSLLAKRVIERHAGGWRLTTEAEQIRDSHLEIPLGVRQLMKSRLASVGAEDRRLLDVLAVAGAEVELDVLLGVVDEHGDDEDAVLDGLDRLIAAGIVSERRAGEVVSHSVTHKQFADVVYRDLRPERRVDLHRRLGAALELHYANVPVAAEKIGEHYQRAGEAGRAYRYLVIAAERLAERSAVAEARELIEKAGALEHTAMEDLPADAYRALRRQHLGVRANAHYVRGEWRQAEQAWRAMLTLAEEDADADAATHARQRLATVIRRQGDFETSRAFAEQALEAARRLHHRQRVADALHCMAALAWDEGRLEAAEQLANEGLLVAQGPTLAEQRANLLLALTAVQATRGSLASATAGLTEAEGIYRELRMKRPRCMALANLAELLLWQGEPLQARQRANSAVQLAVEMEYRLGRVAAERTMALAALDLGRYAEAESGLQLAASLAREAQLTDELVACHVGLTQLTLELDRDSEALAFAERGVALAGEGHDPERAEPLLRALGARVLARTDPERAQRWLDAAEDRVAELPIPRRSQVQLALGWAWRLHGNPQVAQARARTVVQTAGSRGFRLLSLEARALMTLLTEGDEQRTHRAVGQELARDFTVAMSDEMARAFALRPFLRLLDDAAVRVPPGS